MEVNEADRQLSEKKDKQTTLEVKSELTFTEKDLDDLNKLTIASINTYDPKDESNESYERLTSAFAHCVAFGEANRRVKYQKPTSFVLARNKDGELVGYSVVALDPTSEDPLAKVESFGIGVNEKSENQGIGTEVLRLTHAALLNLGVDTYIANVREKAVRLWDKLGVRYTATPLPKSNAPGKQLTVFLK